MALQDAVSLETYVEALWITPAVVFSQLKYSWTEKIGEKWQKIVLFYSIWSKIDPQGPLARVGYFQENGAIFGVFVENTWKYIKLSAI